MANLRADTISGIGSGGVTFEGVTKINTQNYFYLATGTTEQQFPNFAGVDATSARGLFAGGYTVPSVTNVIEYITISSTGNSQDFGDLTTARQDAHSSASPVRGVFATSGANTLDYVTIASTGNAQDFGDATRKDYSSATGNSTRGVYGGGNFPTRINTIEYITIANPGIAVDFGDLTTARAALGACSSPTRAVFGGGYTGGGQTGSVNTIDYITTSTTGNAVSFGSLTTAKWFVTACSNSTRGLFAGGYTPAPGRTSVIDYITIASTGNAISFGNLTVARAAASACASSIRGVFGGGSAAAPVGDTNTIDYVTIASTGNAVDFGDLAQSTSTRIKGACSNGHGGLG